MEKDKLKIEFGQPKHGWLPVGLKHCDFSLHFMASDVPINPIDQLISGIRQLAKGIKVEVWWHLEPEGYYFDFDRKGEQYSLKISFAKREVADRELIYEIHGTFDDLVMPFYRSIKKFLTQAIEEPHWPKTERNEIEALANIIKIC